LLQSKTLARLGRGDEAKQVALAALDLIAGIKLVADARVAAPRFRAVALAAAGRLDEALEVDGRGAADYAALGNAVFAFDTDRAEFLAQAGRTVECVELLAKLLRVPSGLTVPMLKVDPVWDNLRDDPAFKALLADPKNSAPL
jgi:serine/threonine-protein kinase